MEAYHNMLVHFPLALWTTAALIIVVRAVSDSIFARAADRILVPLLALGVAFGIAAWIVGLLVWPLEAVLHSPMARNHVLAATWSLGYWFLVMYLRWRGGEELWAGLTRWIMLGLAALGAGLLTIAGTLGGHLAGAATAVSKVLGWLGWNVYTTFYLPYTMIALVVIAAVVLVLLGWKTPTGSYTRER